MVVFSSRWFTMVHGKKVITEITRAYKNLYIDSKRIPFLSRQIQSSNRTNN